MRLRKLVKLIFIPMNKAPCSVCNYTLYLYLMKRKYEIEKNNIVSTDRSSGLSKVDKQTAPMQNND